MEPRKYRSQLLAAWEQLTIYLRRAQKALVGLGRNAGETLRETFRARMNDTRDLFRSSLDAMVVTGGKISKCRSLLFASWEQSTLYLRQAEKALVRLGKRATERPREALRARVDDLRDDLRDLFRSSHDAMVVAGGKISKCRSLLFASWEQSAVYPRQAQRALAGLGRRAVEKPRRLRRVLRVKENNLRKLLAGSLDAIVVMDVGRRLVAANPKALDLLGVSETNLKKFTIDAFLSRSEALYFNGNGSPFKGREERHGECKIRRLDGGLRVAEYVFVANFAPYQHLCRFCNVRTARIKSFAFNSGQGNNSNTVQLH
jgi:PAS domain-containing protein